MKRKEITVIHLFAILYCDEAFQHVFLMVYFQAKKNKRCILHFHKDLTKEKK